MKWESSCPHTNLPARKQWLLLHFCFPKALSCIRLFATLWIVACQPPVCGIFQARILEWVVSSFSRGSCQPRDQTHISCVSCTAGEFFTHRTITEMSAFQTSCQIVLTALLIWDIQGKGEIQAKLEKLCTVSKNKTGSWLWLRSWTSYCKIQTYIEESRENH